MANYTVLSSTRSESDREGEEARERAEDCLTSSCQKEKMNNRNEGRCTCPVDITTLSVETHTACKAVCIKDMIQLLTHSVSITQLDLYLQCTKDTFSFTLFVPPDNHLSIPFTLALSHTLAPSHPHPVPPPTHTHTRPQHSDLAPAISYWPPRWWEWGNGTIWLDYAGKSRGNPSHSYVHSKTWVSNFHDLACMLHQTKTGLNRHFRCAGPFPFTGSLLERQTRADRVLDSLETILWLTVQVDFKIVVKLGRGASFDASFTLLIFCLFVCFVFYFLFCGNFRICSIASALNTTTHSQSALSWIRKSLVASDSTGPKHT